MASHSPQSSSSLLSSLVSFPADGVRMATAEELQKTWELAVQVDQRDGDESMKFKLRVKGSLHIGGLMLKLVEKISEFVKSSPSFISLLQCYDGWAHPCLHCIFPDCSAIVLPQCLGATATGAEVQLKC